MQYDNEMETEEDMLTGFNLNETASTVAALDDDDLRTSRFKPDGDLISEPETEYLDFSNVSSMAVITEQSLDERNCQILSNESEAFLSSTEMSEVFSIRRKMFNVRIRAKVAPECEVSGQATKNGIRISISPRKTISTTTTSEGISVKSGFRETVMRELSQSAANKKVLHYLESLSSSKPKSRKSLEKEFLHNNPIPRRKSDIVPKNTEKVSLRPRKSSPLPQKRPLSPPESTDMNCNKIRRSTSSEYEDCYDEICSTRATEGSTEWTTDGIQSDIQSDIQSSIPMSPVKDTRPMIRITQEMSSDMVVTSRVDVNKEKVRKMQAKKKATRQIITDNFCNEILDQTINCMRTVTQQASPQPQPSPPEVTDPIPTAPVIDPPPDKPPRTFEFNRSSSLGSLDSNIYEELKQLNLFEFHNRTIVPRYDESEYGYTPPEKDTPEVEQVQLGWSPQVLTMLHYSDDDQREKIKKLGTMAQPQARKAPGQSSNTVGPKLDIDTVDGKSNAQASTSTSTQTSSRISDSLSQKFKRTKEICKRFLDKERKFQHPKKAKTDKLIDDTPFPSVDDFLRSESNHSSRSIQSPRKPRSAYVTPEKGAATSFANTPSSGQHSDRIDRSAETIPACEKYPARKFNSNAPLPQSPKKRFSFRTPKKSPLRFFKSHSNDVQESYRSFGEPDLAVTMGEILKQLRDVIEPDRPKNEEKKTSTPQTVPKAPPRRRRSRAKQLKRCKSMSSEYVARKQIVQIDLHDEPSYAEVLETSVEAKSVEPTPKKWHTIKGVPHVILNDDPNAVYATVRKIKPTSRSSEDLVSPSEGSARRRISFHEAKRPVPDVDQIERFIYEERRQSIPIDENVECKGKKVQENYQRKIDKDNKAINIDESQESGAYRSFTNLDSDLTLKLADPVKMTTEDDVRSIHINYESGGSDQYNNEAGYEVIDFHEEKQEPVCLIESVEDESLFESFFTKQETRQITSLDSSFTNSSPRNSSICSSPTKTPKSVERNHQLYHSLTRTLRNSLRKGTNFMRNEKLSNRFDQKVIHPVPKPARSFYSLDDYKQHYNNTRAEKIFQRWVHRDKLNAIRSPYEREMFELVEKIAWQRHKKTQLHKALSVCRNSKEFDSSVELVEAERLLLVSNLQEAVAKQYLLDYEEHPDKVRQIDPSSTGTICLKDFEFTVKDATVHDTLHNHFFMCVCTYKTKIVATFAKECHGNKIQFGSIEMKFWEVDADYKVKVEVFALSIKKNCHSVVESRFQSIKNVVKLSPKRFFQPSSPKAPVVMGSEFSGFKSQGFFYINSDSFCPHGSSNFEREYQHASNHFVQTMDDYQSFKFTKLLNNPHIENTMWMGIKSDIIFNQTDMQGFLNVAVTNVLGAWNRRWCKLTGFKLQFWNYPQDVTEKQPIETIDLRKCLCDTVSVAAREVCPKKNCMEIPIESDNLSEPYTQMYFLVADDTEKLGQWLHQINQTLKYIEDWSII